MLDEGERLLRQLVAHDDWLPEEFAAPSPEGYRQYLLHCDPLERFSVVSFVWMPGQKTPIHDHTVWGLVGVMRGEELCEEYSPQAKPLARHPVQPGDVDRVSPRIGDVHVVSNAGAQTAVSIHVYGANIGAVRRHVLRSADGQLIKLDQFGAEAARIAVGAAVPLGWRSADAVLHEAADAGPADAGP